MKLRISPILFAAAMLLAFISSPHIHARAQGVTRLCVEAIGANGSNNCVEVSAGNPLPVTGGGGGGGDSTIIAPLGTGTSAADAVSVTCISGCSGSGGTSSAFGSAFPAAGTAIGLTDGTNMVPWLATANFGTSPGAINVPAVNAAAVQAGAWTVEPGNTANTTPWLVTGTGGTFPISGPFATAANQTNATQKTQIVDGSGNVISSTSNNLDIQCANCSGSGVSTADQASFTAGASLFAAGGGFYQTAATANPLTTGQQGLFQVTAQRALFANLRNSSGTEIATASTPLQVSLANTAANGTPVLVTGTGGAFPITAASLPLPTGAATAALQPTNAAQGSTTSGQTGHLAMGAVTTAAPTYTTGQTDLFSLDTAGNLRINCTTGCSSSGGSSQTDEGVFTAGSTSFTAIGGLFQTSISTLANGHAGAAALTSDRNIFVNLNKLAGTALGSPSNYGTSPGAVQVQGVNAFITNSPTIANTSFGISGALPAFASTPTFNCGTGCGGGGGAATLASGSVASGAYSSGSIASGAFAAGAFAAGTAVDGWDLSVQSTTASAGCGSGTGVNPCLKQIDADIKGPIAAQSNHTTNIGAVDQISPYPATAVPITASATGTTAATTATLTNVSGHLTYICGFAIRANATTALTGNATVTGTISGTMNYTQFTPPLASGLGITEQTFSPCIPASAVSTSIAVTSAAPGAGGTISVTAWGFSI